MYTEIDSLWSEFLEKCEMRWSETAQTEAPSASGVQRLRHASDDTVAQRASEKVEPKEKRQSGPKKLNDVQIANSSLAMAKDRTRSLRGPWYSQHWHLFAPFLSEDLRPRTSRLALQLMGQCSETSAGIGERIASKEGDGGFPGHGESASEMHARSVEQPRSIVNGRMFPYQLEGLRWMVRQHECGVGGILGDEMGLGKTLQVP